MPVNSAFSCVRAPPLALGVLPTLHTSWGLFLYYTNPNADIRPALSPNSHPRPYRHVSCSFLLSYPTSNPTSLFKDQPRHCRRPCCVWLCAARYQGGDSRHHVGLPGHMASRPFTLHSPVTPDGNPVPHPDSGRDPDPDPDPSLNPNDKPWANPQAPVG